MYAPILTLVLKKKWFDMILADVKKEEYREITPYWSRIFQNGKIKIKGKFYHPSDVLVRFVHGYSKNRPQNDYYCKGLKVGEGKKEWGAEPGKQYFILQLGDSLPF